MIIWRKSSYSGGGGSGGQECVELARIAGAIGIRDSKAPEAGLLALTPEVFARLVAQMKRDEPDA
jgi:hypothetical protein